MRLNDIIAFLRVLRAGEIRVSDDEKWVRCSCPLAPFTHIKGTDENPSFGISVNDEGESGYNCFTCGSGRLSDLIHVMHWTVGISKRAEDFYSISEIFYGEERGEDAITNVKKEYWDEKYGKVYTIPPKMPVPTVVLRHYPLLEGNEKEYEAKRILEYLVGRGIPDYLLYEYKVRYDPHKQEIIFPIIDDDSKIYRLHVRNRRDKTFYYKTPDNTGYPDLDSWGRKDYWFGYQFYDPSIPAYLVESETDLLRLRALGVENVIATCGSLTPGKLDRLSSPHYYLGFDSDSPGAKFTYKAIRHLSEVQPSAGLTRLNWNCVLLPYYTPKRRIRKWRPAKDAGDIATSEQLEKVFKHASPIRGMGASSSIGNYYSDAYNT
jgi:hypothetical protein